MVRYDWGSTDDEIKANAAANPMLTIEVCGTHKGYGVIIRDPMRNPIIVVSGAVEYVSPFYHELQGFSVGLKLARKYKMIHLDFDCVSEEVAEYIMESWDRKYECNCLPRFNSSNPGVKKKSCVKCSKSIINDVASSEKRNTNKILSLMDEILYDGLELEREGGEFDVNFIPYLYSAKGVWHLASLGVDQELRLNEIDDHEEIADILYKEVYGHGSVEELMSHLEELKLSGGL
ncbi:hypothetical protein MKW94_008448 [Papaver nudicaule]|uniref:RNase H type-1 domain-containing protein n=1 Tax=Papaver nudicaule TaxID=74823 RepID=A0AA41S5Q7_PAPNU|nr:hypothetical protein [Papaver nudicaule]